MTWRLAWTEGGLRDLQRLDRAIQIRIKAKLESVMDNPLRSFSELRGDAMLWKLRVGDHRLIALVIIRDHVVEVQAIEHRSVAYR